MRDLNHICLIATAVGLLVGLPPGSVAQQKSPPQNPVRAASALLLYPSGPTRVVETFSLIQQANQGIPAAQMELGYRYIVGRGIPVDSAQGAAWILKAAANNMALAQFNAGILHTHAIGVEWNPFSAYRWFKRAAQQELPAGQFVYGILFAEGLVVAQDNARAYQLVKTAFDQGYEKAGEVLEEFRRRGFDTLSVSASDISAEADSSSRLVMLNFENVEDPNVTDTVLVRELRRELGALSPDSSALLSARADSSGRAAIALLRQQAERGIPEAHMVLGRMYEKGLGLPLDRISAAVHYLRANRLDSPRAPAALVRLLGESAFRADLLKRAQEGNADARFVWASLSAIEMDNVIGWEQALRFLAEQSGGPNPHPHSCLELGFWYASGRHVPQDPRTAIALWERADTLGSAEGRTRAELTKLLLRSPGARDRAEYLRSEGDTGSVLAQAGYAYCLRFGIGAAKNKPEAASWYRRAAQRGSLSGFFGLMDMYDELRPDDEEFRVE